MIRKMIWKILKKIKSLMYRTIVFFTGLVPKAKHDRDEWQEEGQEGEFIAHQKDKWRETSDFMDQTRKLFSCFGFPAEAYEGKTILDLGAGSKLRSKYFTNAKIIALEPLADRFIKEIPWCDLPDADKVYSSPAEECIDECVNMADLVISINVLDHCYDFEHIIKNIKSYLKDDGLAFLSFDIHYVVDQMHPLILTEPICEKIFVQEGLTVEKCSKGAGNLFTTYGHGLYCLNYWLRKAQ